MAPIRARLSLGSAHPEGGLTTPAAASRATDAPAAASRATDAPAAATRAPDAGARAIPVRTHILTPRDDLVDVVRTYALPLCRRDSVVTIAESAVAIVQRRYYNPDDIRPSLWARAVARFVDRCGSLSSPYALQAVMNEEGTLRVTTAFVLGTLSRLLLRRKGDFYRLAGAQAALVDDVTGTLPPFDKYIVMGPARPQEVVDEIGRALHVEAAIVDANDLGLVAVVAATRRVDERALVEALRSNPAGNDDEQTPIVVVHGALRGVA